MPPPSTALHPDAGWRFDHSYGRLPEMLYRRVSPVPVKRPRTVLFNRSLALSLGLDANALEREEAAALFAGNELPPGSDPIAQAYAGHQFGHFTMLGDGRAILLGEHLSPGGERHDIQLKGSGRTPFSRGGDGRAALGPMLREYLVSEAMHALGIPTTRSLAVAATGETVRRDTALPGAVLVRVAASHIRTGTFEWAAASGDGEALRALTDHVLRRHFPDRAETGCPALGLLEAAMEAQADLVARWQLVGFIHGVMNTDNMALSGETIDYGPCAFLDAYDPATVFSSIDRQGRYAYENQPVAARWNLARLAEALLPLLDPDPDRAVDLAKEVIHAFPARFVEHWLAGMRSKLGLLGAEDGDRRLIDGLLGWMEKARADFTRAFRALSAEPLPDEPLFADPEFLAWHADWSARLEKQDRPIAASLAAMRRCNPAVIPRNHRVEEALDAAVDKDDLKPMEKLLAALSQPWEDKPEHAVYREPPAPGERPYQTYCGT